MDTSIKSNKMTAVWHKEPEPNFSCQICGSSGGSLLLEVPSHFAEQGTLKLHSCSKCENARFDQVNIPDYSLTPDFITTNALELGAGIDTMIRSLRRLKCQDKKHRLLEVGCSLGYLVHFAEKQLGWYAVGVDPSPACLVGRELLGTKLSPGRLEDHPELEQQEFDIVFASEVIEHVAAPESFMTKLRGCLSNDGVLILTTPNACKLSPSMPNAVLMACLSPGYHINIFSAKSLELLLLQAGFSNVQVLEEGYSLIAYASPRPFSLSTDIESYRLEYLNYLCSSLECLDRPSKMTLGLMLRIMTELVNTGQSARAQDIFWRLKDFLWAQYQISLDDASDLRARMSKAVDSASLEQALPISITVILYYVGMLHLLFLKDFDKAARYFELGFDLSWPLIAIDPTLFQEPIELVWRHKYHEAFADLLNGKREDALDKFLFVLKHKDTGLAGWEEITIPEDLIANCTYQIGIAYLQLQRFEHAESYFHELLRECRRRPNQDLAREAQLQLKECAKRQQAAGQQTATKPGASTVSESSPGEDYNWLKQTLIPASAEEIPLPISLPDNLLLSVPPTFGFGGLLWLEGRKGQSGSTLKVIDRLGTTGLCLQPGVLVRALPHPQHAVFLVYQSDGRVLHFALPEFPALHDVRFFQGRLHGVSSGNNELARIALSGEVEERFHLPGGAEAWHINCLDLWGERLVASAFGKFDKPWGWEGQFEGNGIVFDFFSREVLWSGLSLPHTPRSDGEGRMFVCDSYKQRLLVRESDGTEQEIKFPGFFTRGLAITDTHIYVGLNHWQDSNNIQVVKTGGKLAVLSRRDLQVMQVVDLPCAEIYDIVQIPVLGSSTTTASTGKIPPTQFFRQMANNIFRSTNK